MTALDQSMMRAAMALRCDAMLEQWLASGEGRMVYVGYSAPCGGADGAWIVTLVRPGREPVSVRKADRLDAEAHALGVVMLEEP